MWFEKLTFGRLIDSAAERWGRREALCFEGRRWTFAELRDDVDRAARALDRRRRRARRPRLPVARQPSRVPLPLLRRRQDRRGAGAHQHPLPHARHGVHRRPVRCHDADQRRPGGGDRLPGHDRGADSRPAASRRRGARRRAAYRPCGASSCSARSRVPGTLAWSDVSKRGEQLPGEDLRRRSRRGRPGRHRLHHVHVGDHGLPEGRDAGAQRDPQRARPGQPRRRHPRRRDARLPAPLPRLRRLHRRAHVARDRLAPRADVALRRRRGAAPDRGRAHHDDPRLRHALQGPARAPQPGVARPELPAHRRFRRRHAVHRADRAPGAGPVSDHHRLRDDRDRRRRHRLLPRLRRRGADDDERLAAERLRDQDRRPCQRTPRCRPARSARSACAAIRSCRVTTGNPRRPRGRSMRAAGSTPATPVCCAPTAACASSAATRTCSR